MGRHKPSAKQSIISLLVILTLIGIVSALIAIQANFDIAKLGLAPKVQNTQNQIAQLLEKLNLKPLNPPISYNSENLHIKINGKAPFYIESGFNNLKTQLFALHLNPDPALEIYIYDMTTQKNAFAVFSTQRRSDIKTVQNFDPAFAYQAQNSLFMALSQYYIEIIGFSESPQLITLLPDIAQQFKNMPGMIEPEINELKLLPAQNLIKSSPRLYARAAFGFDEFNNIFAGTYKTGADDVTAFITEKETAQTAKNLVQKYTDFLIENGAEKITDHSLPQNAVVLDFYGSIEIVFYKNNFLAGVHQAPDQKNAELLAASLLKSIGNSNEK
jgi:hypothetical protein